MVCQSKTVFDELKEVRFKMSLVYAPAIIRFALMFRYTSVQSYKLLIDEFRLTSLSLLRKIVTGYRCCKIGKVIKRRRKNIN